MLRALMRKRRRDAKWSVGRVSFGKISHANLCDLTDAFGELRRHIPRFIAEREKGLEILRTVDEYHRMQQSLEIFARRWCGRQRYEAAGTSDLVIEFDPEAASGFALALMELVLICRALSTDDKLLIADIANSMLEEYQKHVSA